MTVYLDEPKSYYKCILSDSSANVATYLAPHPIVVPILVVAQTEKLEFLLQYHNWMSIGWKYVAFHQELRKRFEKLPGFKPNHEAVGPTQLGHLLQGSSIIPKVAGMDLESK